MLANQTIKILRSKAASCFAARPWSISVVFFLFCHMLMGLQISVTPTDSSAHMSVFGYEQAKAESPKHARNTKRPRATSRKHEKSDVEPIADVVRGIDVVLIMDSSGSMLRTDPRRLRDQGAKFLAHLLKPEDRLAIMQFDSEPKLVFDLQSVTPTILPEIDQAIDKISVTGRFTDLQAPIEAAFTLLKNNVRSNVSRYVILLSDGKMDPDQRLHNPEELTKRLIFRDLPEYAAESIQLYTLSLSNAADKELLDRMAKITDGLHYFTPDGEEISLKFSNLVMSLKKPQVVMIEGRGFQIDGSVDEATFYITKGLEGEPVRLISPSNQEFSSANFPTNIRWYKASNFELITVNKPEVGTWKVGGLDPVSGFASLITKLELQVPWPHKNIKAGEEMTILARLAEDNQELDLPGLSSITFYSYKIVTESTGKEVKSGSLADNGKGADDKAGDGRYAAHFSVSDEGQFKAIVGVSSQTFSRQVVLPFEVTKNLISLHLREPDEFLKKPERFEVIIDPKVFTLPNVKASVIATNVESQDEISYNLEGIKLGAERYDVLMDFIPNGKYNVYAYLSAAEGTSRERVEKSESVAITIDRVVEIPAEVLRQQRFELSMNILALVIALCTAPLVGWYLISNFDKTITQMIKIREFEIPEDTKTLLIDIESRIGPVVRPAEPWEKELYALVADAFSEVSSNERLVELVDSQRIDIASLSQTPRATEQSQQPEVVVEPDEQLEEPQSEPSETVDEKADTPPEPNMEVGGNSQQEEAEDIFASAQAAVLEQEKTKDPES